MQYYQWHLNKLLRVILDSAPAPWRLTLVVPVRFVFFTEQGKVFPYTSWTKEHYDWCSEFERLTELRWTHQYRIVATRAPDGWHKQPTSCGGCNFCRPSLSPRRPLPTVKVAVDVKNITFTDSRVRGNEGVFVEIWPDASSGRAVAAHAGKRIAVKRSDLSYSYRDSQGKLITRGQRPAIHEIGHLIGLDHPICPGNEDRCYGQVGTMAHKSIMGKGMLVTTREYQPFAVFLNRLHPGFDWAVQPRFGMR